MNQNYDELEEKINYKFKTKKDLLKRAMTHSSFSNEGKNKGNNYERLEFLGDAILEFVVSDYLMINYPEMPEGQLTRTRASLVCEKSLSRIAGQLQLGDFIRLSHGELKNGGNQRSSILCDVVESTIAAIYLDGGIKPAKKFIFDNLLNDRNKSNESSDFRDYKTQLQELMQKKYKENFNLVYDLVKEEGPDHDKYFYVDAKRNDIIIGRGKGKSKKQAEQQAAHAALKKFGDIK